MSLRYVKKRKLRGVPCFRPILRDPSVSDGAFRTLLLMKSKANHGMVTTKQDTLAKERSVNIRTIGRHLKELEAKRLIRIVHNVSRGQWVESTYSIDDEFYAKNLSKKPRKPSDKNVRAVPYGTTILPSVALVQEVPANVIPLPAAKPVTYGKPRKA